MSRPSSRPVVTRGRLLLLSAVAAAALTAIYRDL